MNKHWYLHVMLCVVLFACLWLLAACGSTQQSGQSTQTSAQPDEMQTEHEHVFGEWVITRQPTCTVNGLQEHRCECGEVMLEEIDALAHTEKISEAVAPTCEKNGLTEGSYCEVCCCTIVAQIEIPATGHTEEIIPATEPTCTEDGYTEEIFCKICTVILVPTQCIPAKGHDYTYSEVTVQPSCTEPGYINGMCHCGARSYMEFAPAHGHEYGDWYVYQEQACLAQGILQRKCIHCTDLQEQTTEPLGHRYSETVVAPTCKDRGYTLHVCSACNDRYVDSYTDMIAHTYTSVVIQPSCGSSGYTEYTCTCGHTYADTYFDPLGHDYEIVVVQPTCNSRGYTTRSCSRCGDTRTYDYTDVLEHQFGEVYYVTEPTCTSSGLSRRDCLLCSHHDDRYVAALGHSYEIVVVESTCTEQGYSASICACGSFYKNEIFPALGHSYVTTIIPATCTEQGYTHYACHCGDNGYKDYVPAQGHRYESVVTSPTCLAGGYTTHTCQGCSDSYVDSYTDIGTHSYQQTVTAATCTEGGYTTFTCIYCSHTYTGLTTLPTGHNFWVWETTTAATCTQNGTESRYCTRCGTVETRPIEATGHSYGTVVTQPTCQHQGYTTHTCTKCAHSYTDAYTAIVDHNYCDWYTAKRATCTEDGQESRYCLFCRLTQDRVIPAAGHSYQEIVTQPTCSSYGSVTYSCACGSQYSGDLIDPLPHTFGEWYRPLDPGCVSTGLDKRDCQVCGASDERVVAANGHDYVATVFAPTCTKQGYTKYTCHCSHYYYDHYTEMIDHVFSDWETVYPSNCTEAGLKHRYCLGCGLGEDEEILPAHSYQPTVTPPTCTQQGYTTYTCGCGDSYQGSYVVPLGHNAVEIPAVEPTYTSAGWTAGTQCSRCDSILQAPQSVGRYIKITLVYDSEAMDVICSEKLGAGARATVAAQIKQGYIFLGWYIGDTLVSTSTEYRFLLEEQDVVLTAKVTQVSVWDGSVANSFAGGSGTQADPYLISSGAQLAYLAQLINSSSAASFNTKYYALTCDINLNGINWDPIGCIYTSSGSADTNRAFKGHFDGRGYTVYNLTIDQSKYSFYRFFGLFGVVEAGGYVEDVHIRNCNITLCDDVTGLISCGGLVGRIVGTTVTRCSVEGNISVSTSYDTAAVMVGGLVGLTLDYCTITDCYTAGNVSCSNIGRDSGQEARAGGIVGMLQNTVLTRCYSTCYVYAQSVQYAISGGLVAHLGGSGSSSTQVYRNLSLASGSADNYGGWYTYTGKVYAYASVGSAFENQTQKTDTVEFYTQTLGWSDEVWDFSGVAQGGLPTLKR